MAITFIFIISCNSGSNTKGSLPDDIILQSLGLNKTDALKKMNINEQDDCEADKNLDTNSVILKNAQSYFDNSFKTSFYFYEGRLNDVEYKAAFDDYDKSIGLLNRITQYMKTKYGEPSTYPGLPNRVVDFFKKENGSITHG